MKTIGAILTEKGFQKAVKIKDTAGDVEKFPTGAYSQFYAIYKDKDFLSIPDLTLISASGGVYNVDDTYMEKWCNDQWSSKDLSNLYKVAKWCTNRKSLLNAAANDNSINKDKGEPSEFTKSDYKDLIKEKTLSKEEKDWLKSLSDVTGASTDRELTKMVDWCSCVTVFTFVDEQDTDEYKRAIKYCIKKEYQKEIMEVTS